MEEDLLSHMTQRYQQHELPWDVSLPPPEVLDLATTLPSSRALDLGCGTGRACIYLAQHGWQCDGVDFIAQAITLAQARAQEAGVADATRFYHASVTQLDFLQPFYDLVLDVGCLHAQPIIDQQTYAEYVIQLTRPSGWYVLFAHLYKEHAHPQRRWITEHTITSLFSPAFSIARVERGTTTVGEDTWPSAWFWMQRHDNA